ncbi:MAG: hypothetical protein FWE28_07695 [Oscillospiraceae bacterium]|nr:hypothetical protein [Oscillospiraceae bacterium]
MKRTNFVFTIISILLFVFVVVYFGISMFQSVQNPLRTVPAVTAQSQESFFAPGLIIREEVVSTPPYPVVASTVREGERVSVGMAYLVAYDSLQDLEQGARRSQLAQEITHLETRLAQGTGGQQEAEIRRQLRNLNYAARQGDFEQLDTKLIEIGTLLLAGDETELTHRLATAQTEYERLGSIASSVRPIAATQAGVFSARVDGYEHLGPSEFSWLDVAHLQEILDAQPQTAPAETPGKLVVGMTWYYAALVPTAEGQRLQAKLDGERTNRVSLNFSGVGTADIPMRVYSLGQPTDGYQVAVFAANTALVETLGLRRVEAMIIYDTFTGIRVPREALHRGEPNPETGHQPAYVFTLTVQMAERKFVEIVHAGADYYLVRPDNQRTSPEVSLREGNTIIVRAGELYDGRVIRR